MAHISVPQATVAQAFMYFVHLDKSNAAIHGSAVRFSPITFRLMEALAAAEASTFQPPLTGAWTEVRDAQGQYLEDKGR